MPNIIQTPNFLGICGSSYEDHNTEHLRSELSASEASVLPFASSTGFLAVWQGGNAYCDVNEEGFGIALLGHPRWRAQEPQTDIDNAQLARLILERFRRDGEAVLNNLVGDFAVAIIDSARKRTLLAVDRIGIGTLFHTRLRNGSLLFATDLDMLRSFAGEDHPINLQAIYDYAYYHAVPSPLTIYSGISKIPPAHKVVHSDGSDQVERYWLPDFVSTSAACVEELEAELFDVLRRSVSRCATGTSVGGFLSGGLDSSTVCGLLRETADHPVRAVSVGFDVEGYDEISFARVAANHFDLSHLVHYMTPDEISDSISLIADAYSEPFGNSSVVPSYICAKTACEDGVSMLLGGDGGDELFAGNTRYAKQKLFEYYFRLPGFLRAGITDPLLSGPQRPWQLGPLRKLNRYVSQANIRLPDRLQTFNLLEMRPIDDIFGPAFLSEVEPGHPLQLLRGEYGAADADAVNRMLLSDWRFALADNDLRKVSRTCQLAGIDVRYPLLDDEVVEFSARVPAALKLKGLKLRHFYRHALRDYLPTEVLNKSKHGFGLPFGEWLKGSDRLREMVHDALSDLRKRGIFLDSFVDSLLQDHRHQHAAFYGNMVWVLAMLEWWLANHNPEFKV